MDLVPPTTTTRQVASEAARLGEESLEHSHQISLHRALDHRQRQGVASSAVARLQDLAAAPQPQPQEASASPAPPLASANRHHRNPPRTMAQEALLSKPTRNGTPAQAADSKTFRTSSVSNHT